MAAVDFGGRIIVFIVKIVNGKVVFEPVKPIIAVPKSESYSQFPMVVVHPATKKLLERLYENKNGQEKQA